MIVSGTLQFLKNLKKNNRKEWFDKNRSKFDEAKKNVEETTAEIIKRFSKTDESLAHLLPKDCMFRINRDVRFSKNKSPYKTNMGVYFSKGGKKGIQAGYYFHIEPGAAFVAGGLWMPMPQELKKVRQEIDYNWDEFFKIVNEKNFKKMFGQLDRSDEYVLSRPPKGYDDDNPAIEYLKLKSLIATRKIPDSELSGKDVVKNVVGYFGKMKPFIDFINRAVEE
ncbi:MAG: DUF2461 domain-containing protein [Chitinophagaceae bacterium]|nr:DUF2461 domain-containing protein [Chitinophagaceae bacterium]